MTDVHVHVTQVLNPEDRALFRGINQQLAANREALVAISKEIQSILDKAKESNSISQSVHLGMQGLQKKVSELQEKITALPATDQPKPNSNELSQEDKDALVTAASDLDNMMSTLRQDIPANTVADPNADRENPGVADQSNPLSSGQPGDQQGGPGQTVNNSTKGSGQQSADNTQQAKQEDEGGAKPLPGTGG